MASIANDATSARAAQIPQFLNKLLAMVDDPSTDRFIKWSDDGTSFYVFNPDQFAKELLGTYYKTDASASFVRQLNMYGFHKVPHVRQGALKTDKQAQAWHYRNDNFRRGRPDLLPFITRKGKAVTNPANAHLNSLALQSIKQPDADDGELELLSNSFHGNMQSNTNAEVARGSPKSIDMNQIITGLATIKRHQTLISDNLKELQTSNQALWQEAMEARERHRKHQDTINRILKFLASLFQGTSATPIRSNSMNGSEAGTPAPTVPRGRLMITDGKHADEENDDALSTPKSSIRMEEVEDEQTSNAQAATVETPKSATETPKGFQAQNAFSAASPPQYPFPDQAGSTPSSYIPPADTWKMLQWLQQNQIPIPGVTYPIVNPQTHNGALTTVPPAGMNINPLAFGNMFTNPADMNALPNPAAAYNPATGATPNWMNAANYGPPVLSNGVNALGLPYADNSQLFNSFLPLANVASEPPPPVSVEQVSQRTDKLDQLSTSVEAMQQGIDSLIQGMGLDPLAAASLQVGAGQLPTHPLSSTDVNASAQTGISLGGTTNGLAQYSHALSSDGLGGGGGPHTQGQEPIYPMDPLDFDLDALLKHIGEKAAGNTPPAVYNTLAGDSTFHPLFFDGPSSLDENGAPSGLDMNGTLGQQHHADPTTTTTTSVFDSTTGGNLNATGSGRRAGSVTTRGTSESPVSTRRDISVEPGMENQMQFEPSNFSTDSTSMANGGGSRQRNKKRKLEDNSTPVAPPQRQASTGGTRSTKRRK